MLCALGFGFVHLREPATARQAAGLVPPEVALLSVLAAA